MHLRQNISQNFKVQLLIAETRVAKFFGIFEYFLKSLAHCYLKYCNSLIAVNATHVCMQSCLCYQVKYFFDFISYIVS